MLGLLGVWYASVLGADSDRNGFGLSLGRSVPIPFIRAGYPRPVFWKHIGLYIYRREFLLQLAAMDLVEGPEGLEQLRVLENGFRIATVETDVDTIGD